MPGPWGPFVPPSLFNPDQDTATIGRDIIEAGRARAEGAERSGALIGSSVARAGEIAGAGVQDVIKQRQQGQIGQTVSALLSQASQDENFDLGAALEKSGIKKELFQPVIAAFDAAHASLSKIKATQLELAQGQRKLQQNSIDYLGTALFHATQPELAGTDGGLHAAATALQMAIKQNVPGVKDFLPEVSRRMELMQKAQASGDPNAIQALAQDNAKFLNGLKDKVWPLVSEDVRLGPTKEKMAGLKEIPAGGSLADVSGPTPKIVAQGGRDYEMKWIQNPQGGAPVAMYYDKHDPSHMMVGGQPYSGPVKEAPTPRDPVMEEMARMQLALLQKQTEGGALSDQAIDDAARRYLKEGVLPQMGMGSAGVLNRQLIMNRAAALGRTGGEEAPDIAANKASLGADTAALKKLQSMTDAVTAFESTANKNADMLKDVMKDVPDLGVRFLNSPIRSLADQLGSKDMARLNAIRQSVQNEFSRILSNPNLTGQLSDSARKEGEKILSGDATVGQMTAALDTLRAEAANRRTSFQGQIDTIKGRIKGKPAATEEGKPEKVRIKYDSQGNRIEG